MLALTLTLSPWERECTVQRGRWLTTRWLFLVRAVPVPSPEGEGQGEGEPSSLLHRSG